MSITSIQKYLWGSFPKTKSSLMWCTRHISHRELPTPQLFNFHITLIHYSPP